jgi:hypothetical protein
MMVSLLQEIRDYVPYTVHTISLFVLKVVRRMYVKVMGSFSVCVGESFSLSLVLNFSGSNLSGHHTPGFHAEFSGIEKNETELSFIKAEPTV